VEITVLGKSPSWQDAGGACSGYLIKNDGFVLLLDCGNGVFSKLRRFAEWARDEASRGFGAPVELAAEGAVYSL
jgi:hypothetical protein